MKKIKRLSLLLSSLGLFILGAWSMQQATAAKPNAWIPAAPLIDPMASQMVKCVDDPDHFYLVGGVWSTTGELNISNALYRYIIGNPGEWVRLADLPDYRQGVMATCYQGKIYAAGGLHIVGSAYVVTQSLFIYDIAAEEWTHGADLPDVIDFGGMGAWDGKLYVMGGVREHQYLTPVKRVDVYDIASGTWSAGGGADMPFAATHFGFGAQAGPYYYVVGGFGDPFPTHVNQTQRYNMATNEWELGPEFNSARANHSVAVAGIHLYAISGSPEGGGIYDTVTLVETLDLTNWPASAWEDLGDPVPQGLIQTAATCSNVLTGGEIWLVGGATSGLITVDSNLYRHTEPCVSYGVGLPDPMQGSAAAGETITYTLSITNTGVVTDYFTLEITSLWDFGAPITNIGPVGPGDSVQIEIAVTIPPEAVWGNQDVATVEVASISNPAVVGTTTITTTSTTVWTRIFVPLIMRN